MTPRVLVLLLLLALFAFGEPMTPVAVTPFESPFSADSFWRTPIPADYVVDRNSHAWITELESFGAPAYPKLALTSDWAQPYYVSTSKDPAYTVTASGHTITVHIPADATPSTGSDHSLVVHDMAIGIWVGLWKATKTTKWTAKGLDWYDDSSNGLAGTLPEADQPLNFGHRGMSSALSFVPKAQVDAGCIDHVLKVSIDVTGNDHVWPAVGDENRGGVIPEGVIVRIKPDIDLATKLSGAALVVATALQDYGAVIGDTGGAPFTLKLERDAAWTNVLTAKSLSALTWDDFEFVLAGSRR